MATPSSMLQGLKRKSSAISSEKEDANEMERVFVRNERLLETGAFSDVTVYVGTGAEKKEWKLHKNILSANSGYFKRVFLSQGFKESKSGIVKLPEHDPKVFQKVLNWLYGPIYKFPFDKDYTITWLCDLYKTAMYFDLPLFKTKIMDESVGRLASRQTGKRSGPVSTDYYLEGIKDFLEIYHAEKDNMEDFIKTISTQRFLHAMLGNEDMEAFLRDNIDLTFRLFKLSQEPGRNGSSYY